MVFREVSESAIHHAVQEVPGRLHGRVGDVFGVLPSAPQCRHEAGPAGMASAMITELLIVRTQPDSWGSLMGSLMGHSDSPASQDWPVEPPVLLLHGEERCPRPQPRHRDAHLLGAAVAALAGPEQRAAAVTVTARRQGRLHTQYHQSPAEPWQSHTERVASSRLALPRYSALLNTRLTRCYRVLSELHRR